MKLLILILSALPLIIPSGKANLEPLQKRDSMLVADQFDYGFVLKALPHGSSLALQDLSVISSDTLTLVRNWQLDTIRSNKANYDLHAAVRLAAFEQGRYELPALSVIRRLKNGQTDTLAFDPESIDVYEMPVDTAQFVINDIKPQLTYPITIKEVLPWVGGGLGVIALIVLAIYLITRAISKRKTIEEGPKESPYIVALRSLDKLRDNSLWSAPKQKFYYSSITDALKVYIDDIFSIDAPEMTTAELFAELKKRKELNPELYEDAKALFELADFVKFAKHTASDEENAAALPTAIRFVMNTYTLEEEHKEDVL